jgi:hypothetical protein
MLPIWCLVVSNISSCVYIYFKSPRVLSNRQYQLLIARSFYGAIRANGAQFGQSDSAIRGIASIAGRAPHPSTMLYESHVELYESHTEPARGKIRPAALLSIIAPPR